MGLLTKSQRERMQEWIDALKSGKYRHGKTRLRIGNTYCCLGVLCDLVDHGAWKPVLTADDVFLHYGETAFPLGDMGTPFGLADSHGCLYGPDRTALIKIFRGTGRESYYTNLAQLNDVESSFDAVIAVLECYLRDQNVNRITVTSENGVYTAVGSLRER